MPAEDGMNERYTLAKLRLHTESIRAVSTALLPDEYVALDAAIRAIDTRMREFEGESKTTQRNAAMLLFARIVNHVYSALLLSEAGLYADAVGCERAMWESLAAYFLVLADPEAADDYFEDRLGQPRDVRKRLTALGHPDLAKDLNRMFAPASNVLHVSRRAERWNVGWTGSQDAELHIGGRYSPDDHRHLVRFYGSFLSWLATYHREMGVVPPRITTRVAGRHEWKEGGVPA